jgi:hypothetical protein
MFIHEIMAEIHYRSMEALLNKSDDTIYFMIGGLAIHFAGIFHLSGSVQKPFKNFILVQWLNFVFYFWGKYDPKIFFAYLDTPKRHFLEKMCVD